MARFCLWVVALSLVCLIAVVTSQPAPTLQSNSNEGNIVATCTKYFDVGSTMSASSAITMVFNEYISYFPMMTPDWVRLTIQTLDTAKDNRLNLNECEKLVNYIIQNAPDN